MTGPDAAEHPGDPSRPLKRSRYSAHDQEELDLLDTIVKRIKVAVPPTPYILSTPSLDPYRYHSQQQANAWMIGRLWRPDEEHLQYRTYLYREPCQDCFELQAGQDEEPEPEPPRSQAVNGQPTKKKPNLSAFKVKQVNGAAAPGAKISSSSRPPTKNTSDQANGATKSEKLSAPAQKAEPRSPGSSSNNMRDDRKATREAAQVSSRPRAPSTSQKSDTASYKSHVEKSDPSNSTPHGLPPLLSPVREPLGNPYGLPTILSPTLPSNVQAELDRLEVQRKRADSDASISSSDIKSAPIAVPPDSSQKSSASLKTENRGRSLSINGKSPNPEPVSPSQQTRANMIVKLKFSKPKAQVVSQILRLPPKRSSAEKKERTDTPKATATDNQPRVTDPPVIKKKPVPKITARRTEPTTPASTSTPTTSAKPTPASAKVVEKRLRTEEDCSLAVPPAKRPRASSTNEPPVTSAPTTASPAASAKPSAQKSNPLHPTPKKDIRSMNMLRTQSSESNEATPGRSGATPAGSKAELKAGPTSAPLNNKKQIDISLLGQTSAKLNQTGRALKHEATKILNTASSKKDEKRAAVTNLECILAYMAAYFAQDLSLNLRGRAGEVEQTWKTLLPLCLSYSRCTRDFQHLDGLRSYLSSVIASAICTHVSQRFSSSKSHDSPQDINHPESARQHIENFALLSDHTLKMNRHYQEARIALPFEDLQNIYKKTYAGREVNAKLAREPEKVSGAKMSGPYFLPLGIDTTPIQAVRFGLKFLHEYCEKEKLEYSLRVNLDRPE
ncbi:hypothetical protein COCC4DRAFT_70980 [Bipolaris maydis ATCC 48331]|uniref:Uncharacterized protein n=2 Tax=Cochliobolus heterostrophus TaxID=5016 RepID=M2SQG8_COCH5|nr:uncharacterized protein COCC4DRAFT_70980 [Bipolaris maydis ATCC 48331]EMD87555.1 hypothetical protein COCHEDRAFT_1227773 [Bipolaris maydis C5]KAH7554929.1 hypothetical protein BM1_07590 [Bipolaris maydis]ENI06756.1 hypothetical protein COCC4DRAFT_70980 [Bipolaris maydis ATCC 48331]KAJ5023171.1 hypothetical protein J3E73DRAFT_384557 [Bipolaris maydis]KAJ5056079.1 hypothetical protein J3E74DRAFT_440996 [Bipolaris maydis]